MTRIDTHLDWMCYLPLIGLSLLYSYYPLALLFGDFDGPLFQTDPKRLGTFLAVYFRLTSLLILPLVLSLLPCALLLTVLLLERRLSRRNAWHAFVLFSAMVILYVCGIDPFHYLAWYFD